MLLSAWLPSSFYYPGSNN
ncbi:hypothetical protein PENANT_c204G10905 [Penicillium antarcticum]|uniref:Uncharacterized protein n=1 Tax=Penicillium antarcticum TaxID=416450 RepID=A0A1V6P9W2_9EURO|nr:hypothetical protein PENANT_c204G10905 [Penicillium antarcticum]